MGRSELQIKALQEARSCTRNVAFARARRWPLENGCPDILTLTPQRCKLSVHMSSRAYRSQLFYVS